jgi:hypothetical protein
LQTQNYDHALYTVEVLRLYGRQLRSKEDVQYGRECGSAHPATEQGVCEVGRPSDTPDRPSRPPDKGQTGVD